MKLPQHILDQLPKDEDEFLGSKKTRRIAIGIFIVYFLCVSAFATGVIYVIWHFISKWW